MRFRRSVLVLAGFGALAISLSTAASTDTAATILARYKSASGGSHWDAVKTLQIVGTNSSGGLSGAWQATQDLIKGRSSNVYKLGPIDGADGYDGVAAWRRDTGGEVAVLDAPTAMQRARSQSWLDARAYWYPSRRQASYGPVQTRQLGGQRYRVIEATPQGGNPIALWFDADSGLLSRIVQPLGLYTMTTVLNDYRNTAGLLLPYHATTDLTDAAGRTDPRRRTEFHYQRIALNTNITDADFAIPAMSATSHIDSPDGISQLPFELLNNHIYVDGEINGQKARLLVDTGGVNILTPAAAHKFGLVSEGTLAEEGAGDHDMDLGFAHVKSMRIGAAVIADTTFEVTDLGDMSKVEGVDFDGMIGYEIFRRFDITVDYARHRLTLAEPAKFMPPPGATALNFVQDDRAPIIEGILDGIPLRLWVDTGSRSSLSFFSPFVRKHRLLEKYRATADAVVGWGLSGPSRAHPTRLGILQIGNLTVTGIAGDLTTTDKGAFADPDLDADLGSGALRRFIIAIDYATKHLYLLPNAALDKPDPFDRSGLWLMVDGDALKVTDVAKDSAADRAHLRENDRIVSINGEPVAKRALSDWRSRLRNLPVESRITVEFRRAGNLDKTELVLADRIPAAWK